MSPLQSRPPPAVVVFDLGGVLIDWDPRHLFRKLFPDPAQMDWFLSHVCTHGWHEQVDAGIHPDEIVPGLQAKFPQYEREILAYHDRFYEMFGEPFEPMIQLLDTLKQTGVALFALTNWGKDSFPWARRTYPFLSLFQDIVVSGEEGLLKPDPRIFHRLFARGGFGPASAVFIDDRLPNVEVGRALGMQAIHHLSAPVTIKALRQLGLPI